MPNIAGAVAASALIVVSGAAYALLLALGRNRNSRPLLRWTLGAYAVLVLAAIWLAWALRLDGFWMIALTVAVAGYWLAPRAVWHLCVGTHEAATEDRHG